METLHATVIPADSACAYLGGISRTGLWRLDKAGAVRGAMVAGRRMYLVASLDEYLQRQFNISEVDA